MIIAVALCIEIGYIIMNFVCNFVVFVIVFAIGWDLFRLRFFEELESKSKLIV